ncbi:MAG: hypothetical protein Q8L98_05905 [Chlamydiales bacterium]|nr:hypothetical protein [Chlamydiales bacterium]
MVAEAYQSIASSSFPYLPKLTDLTPQCECLSWIVNAKVISILVLGVLFSIGSYYFGFIYCLSLLGKASLLLFAFSIMLLEENFKANQRSAQALQDQIISGRDCQRLKNRVTKLEAETESLKDPRERYRSGSSKKAFKTWR